MPGARLKSPSLTISMEELILPAVHVCGGIRIIRSLEKLALIRGYSLPPYGYPQNYYWAYNNQWYRAVEMRKIKRLPWYKTFFGPSDVTMVQFMLVPVEQPFTCPQLYRELIGYTGLERRTKRYEVAKQALRKCKTAQEVIDWFEREARISAGY